MTKVPAERTSLLLVAPSGRRLAELKATLAPLDLEILGVEGTDPLLFQAIDRTSFAAVILELAVPEDALTLAQRIRAQPNARITPLLLISVAPFSQEIQERLYALGSVEIVQSPPAATLQAKAQGFAALFDAARESRREADQLRMLVQGTKDYAIFMLDAGGHVVSWNSGAEHLKGYTADEIIGRHLSTFYPADVVASGWIEHELKTAVETGRFEDEGWRIRKDGSRFWANVVITALRDERGE